MCLAALAIEPNAQYKLVCVANRDEFHARPTAAMHWWPNPSILAGQDLEALGTWMGLNKCGRFGLLTNVRNPSLEVASDAPSRGSLVVDFLESGRTPEEKLATRMAGFNLITGNLADTHWSFFTNQPKAPGTKPQLLQRTLAQDIHGLSNGFLNAPWPKTLRLKARLAELLEGQVAPLNFDALFGLLADQTLAEDSDLPRTGVPYEWEKMLSAIQIVSPVYGTRAASVLTVDRHNNVCIEERTLSTTGEVVEKNAYQFTLAGV